MLPSTFQEESKEQEKLKKRLKAKLEVAKFLQDTLEETSLQSSDKSSNQAAHKFADFMKKIRTKGEQPTTDEIMKYSSLFENELTLNNLSRQQLIALCQILDVSTLANIPPNDILRFQLKMKIRNLEADDKMILKEGVDTLTIEELQLACRERGMRSIGVSERRLRKQLEQWLDLHLNRKIPLSLLILSRALYLPEQLPIEDKIKSTISALPKSIENATVAKVTEVAGGKVDNTTKLELLKQEQDAIKQENAAKEIEHKKKPVESTVPAMKPAEIPKSTTPEVDFAAQQIAKEKLVDKATVMTDGTPAPSAAETAAAAAAADSSEVISPGDIKEINDIIEDIPHVETKQVKAEIAELKKELTEYKEDVKEVEELSEKLGVDKNAIKLKETKAAKALSKRVQKLLGDMDKLMVKIEQEETVAKPAEQT
jgi:LETM1 and EF-hand domain-containing protein 1